MLCWSIVTYHLLKLLQGMFGAMVAICAVHFESMMQITQTHATELDKDLKVVGSFCLKHKLV